MVFFIFAYLMYSSTLPVLACRRPGNRPFAKVPSCTTSHGIDLPSAFVLGWWIAHADVMRSPAWGPLGYLFQSDAR